MNIICKVCNKPFYFNKKTRITCSRYCSDILKPKKPRIEITCAICGKKWYTTKAYRKTCSKQCSKEYTTKKIINNTYKCGKCFEEKPISDFYYYKNKPRGYCKECDKALVLKYQSDNKRNFVKIKGGKCVRCGYNKCIGSLEFHHVDKNTKEFNINKRYDIIKAIKELEKCILLCSNCHHEEHTFKENW